MIISVGIHSSMEASFAAYLLKKPILFIFNLSPRDRLWISNKKWQFPQISDMVVVNQELKDICVNNYGWGSDKIHYIPERIIPQKILCKKKDTIESIAIIRRLDNVKCVPVIKFMDTILSFLQVNKNVSINIIGDGEGYEKVQVKSNAINSILDRQAVNCNGYIDDIDKKLHNYDLIMGTEKVVVESLLFRKPTAILKNNGELIPITMANVKDLSNNNFTGSHFDSLTNSSVEDIINKIESLIEDEISALGQWIENSFSYKIGVSKISILLEKISSPKHFIKKFFFQLIKMYCSIFVNLLRKTVK